MLNSAICGPLNHLLKTSPWARERLREFSGSVLVLEGMPVSVRLVIQTEGYFSAAAFNDVPSVTISLPPDAAVRFLFDRHSLFSAIRIAGAADLAEVLSFVFRNLEWDVEADIASIVGDIPARRMTNASKQLVTGIRSAAQRSLENLREFVIDEEKAVAEDREIGDFLRAVDVLRDDLSRLEKRIDRL